VHGDRSAIESSASGVDREQDFRGQSRNGSDSEGPTRLAGMGRTAEEKCVAICSIVLVYYGSTVESLAVSV
jgi:hypothetical protein